MNKVNQIRQSGRTSVTLRVLHEVDQKGSRYGYYSGGIVYILPEEIQAKIGQRVKISGFVSNDESISPDWTSNVISLINPEIEVFEEKRSSGILLLGYFYEKLVKSRGKMVKMLSFSLPEPHSSISAGMLLGERSQIDKQEYARLQTDGLLHVVAASGSNVILVTSLLEGILRKKGRRFNTCVLLVCIWIYCAYAQFSPTIIRACCMATVQIVARSLGREYIGLWALFLSGACMLAVDPYLVFSISFQLSMLASFAMCEIYPRVVKIFRAENSRLVVRIFQGTFLASVSVTLVSSPLLIYQFASFSLVSFISNFFMLWIVEYVMVFSLVFIILSWILPRYSSIFVIPLWIVCELWVRLTGLFAIVPYAFIQVPKSVGLYLVIPSIYAVFMIYRRAKYVL